MRSLRRWNLALGTIVMLSGFSLTATPAFADPPVCPTESCGNDCAYDCWQTGCTVKSCNPVGCFGTNANDYAYDQQCLAG